MINDREDTLSHADLEKMADRGTIKVNPSSPDLYTVNFAVDGVYFKGQFDVSDIYAVGVESAKECLRKLVDQKEENRDEDTENYKPEPSGFQCGI